MKLQFSNLPALQPLQQVKIHSIDWMIYQISVRSQQGEQLLYEGDQPFRCRNLDTIKELFEPFTVEQFILLRGCSVYDEMVGQSQPLFSDSMSLDLAWRSNP